MLNLKSVCICWIAFALACSTALAQLSFERVASFDKPDDFGRRFSGGREVEFNEAGNRIIVAFYGSRAQLFDLDKNVPIGDLIRTSGDGEVGFVSNNIAYTADWDNVRLWNSNTGEQIGDSIRHELREDTIISPAISPRGTLIATRATMQSVQLTDVATSNLVGTELQLSSNVSSLRFSEDGEILFARAGGALYGIDPATGKVLAGPISAGRIFRYFPSHNKLVTTHSPAKGKFDLVIRSTSQENWPETHRSALYGEASRIVSLGDDQVLVQARKDDYTPGLFTFSVDSPENRSEVDTNADRAFRLVVIPDKQLWICNNIRDITCQKLGESGVVWQKRIPPSGYDLRLYSLDNENFIICDKENNLGVYKVADGVEVWKQAGVQRFSISNNKLAICNTDGVEIWALK